MKVRVQSSIERELRVVLKEIRETWDAFGEGGDPLSQDVEAYFDNPVVLSSFVNALGWARALAWTLRIHPASLWEEWSQ